MGDLESLDTQIADVDDLEDRLLVMDSVVDQLKYPNISKAQIEILMNQYVILEDSILSGLQVLALAAETAMLQQQITDCAEKFNQLGSDYQDSWSDEYWAIYELTREGYQKSDKLKTGQEIANQIADVQDLALNLNRTPQGSSSEGKKILMEIDELSKQHITSTLAMSDNDIIERKCCSTCVVS
ncbi:hypothetical protein SteCoe_23329 [Stentor coeruleus]|uniref:Uncharacterized protein n=1 Tax=Stentor coeruleus TaxID=5963 RepID=A0A1R2BK56_9CILI|nr:hypothetical protein SteCoe_23329 [Stentor coeruleus]